MAWTDDHKRGARHSMLVLDESLEVMSHFLVHRLKAKSTDWEAWCRSELPYVKQYKFYRNQHKDADGILDFNRIDMTLMAFLLKPNKKQADLLKDPIVAPYVDDEDAANNNVDNDNAIHEAIDGLRKERNAVCHAGSHETNNKDFIAKWKVATDLMKVIKLSCHDGDEDDDDFVKWQTKVREMKKMDVDEDEFSRAIAKAKEQWEKEMSTTDIDQENEDVVIDGTQLTTGSIGQGAAAGSRGGNVNIKNKNKNVKMGAQVTAGHIQCENPEALKYLTGKF